MGTNIKCHMCAPIEEVVAIDDEVIWDCSDDHCQFACIDQDVNIDLVICVNKKKDKDKNKDKDKENDNDSDDNQDDNDDTEDDNDNNDHYDNAGPVIKECAPFVQYDEISVKAKCKKGKCSFGCLKGFANINQKTTNCER